MDKNAIKKFAVWARRELIERVSQKALQYGITADAAVDAGADSVGGSILSAQEKQQRQALIHEIGAKGYAEVMEEVAYTWFNRFSALRFMEVNGYLPTHVRVFTDEANNFKPQILDEALHMELKGLDMEKVFACKDANQTEELYKYLLITQCNALNGILPGMFQKIADYTELLLPDNLLREGSVLQQMIELIPEDDWRDAVQIIGWLYQYYNIEPKAAIDKKVKEHKKVEKEEIPAKTQLFTPDWIVRYMVENSLGRLWVEGHPNDELKAGWKYYLEEAEQEPEVQAQLAEIRKGYAAMEPKDIKVIDPCCGSGHILVYLFDVLMQIYEAYGYTGRDAVSSILQNNLYGLDIDDRAAQMAYFAVMMKARQYDRRFFAHPVQPQVYAIQESNGLSREQLDYFGAGMSDFEKNTAAMQLNGLLDTLTNAKEYGSILKVDAYDWALLRRYLNAVDLNGQLGFGVVGWETFAAKALHLVDIGEVMAQKYDTVVTNPPYMGGSGMGPRLSEYVKKHYPDSKADLFAVFIETCGAMTKVNGYQAMITQHAWMFLSSFEKLREKLLARDLVNMAHLGPHAFDEIKGEVVQTTSFVLQTSHVENRKGVYYHLLEPNSQQDKENMFLAGKSRYVTQQENFEKITGSPVIYNLSDKMFATFRNETSDNIADSCCGMNTGDNEKFLRLWHEISCTKFFLNSNSTDEFFKKDKLYAVYNKGGVYRKWYGNLDHVIKFDRVHYEILLQQGNHLPSRQQYFKSCITWTDMSTKGVAFRYQPSGSVFDGCAATAFPFDQKNTNYLLGLLNSVYVARIAPELNPTLHFKLNDYAKIPFIMDAGMFTEIDSIVEQNVETSHADWDSFETSWDFKCDPLVRLRKNMRFSVQNGVSSSESYIMAGAYHAWKSECEERFKQLQANETELNRIFIDIYGLQDELTPEVEDKDVTVYRIFDTKEDIPESMGSSRYALTKQDVVKNFISYAVGCMLGRYSLDVEGLAFAGGEWDAGKYRTFPADADNIIPICDDEYFDDDIVGRFIRFVEVVYGADTLQENLKFIADALGGKGLPKEVIRKYFLNDFFKDHCKTYQKRPIYWLFDSGKKNGFKALVYMHRYQPDTIARIRTDYVHEQQSRYRTVMADLEARIGQASTGERVKLNKALAKLQDQAAELHTYEEKIHHLADQMILIDLDDGVKHNYEIFKDVLAKIK